MSTYIDPQSIRRLEYDNAPDWIVEYMIYRRSVCNDTPTTIMTYFKTLREFFQWISCWKATGSAPNTEEDLRNTNISELPFVIALDVQKGNIEKYLYFLTDTLHNSATTRNKKLVTIRGFYEYLIEQQETLHIEFDVNPAARIRSPKLPKKKPVFLSEEEQQRLLMNVSGENAVRDYAMILVFLSTGIRISEIVRLNLKDVRRDKMQLIVREGKGEKDRNIPLTVPCLNAIDQYLTGFRDPIKDKLNTDALFVSKRFRDRLTTKAVEKALTKQFLRAGLTDVTAHKLRHTAATTLVKDGVDLPFVQKFLGHERADTTEIYVHLDDSDVKNALKTSSINDLGSSIKLPEPSN